MPNRAGEGAAYGSVIPGPGTAVGAGLGALFHKSGEYIRPRNPNEGVWDQNYIDYLNSGKNNNWNGQETDLATLKQFKSIYGRDPTPTEFAMYGPMGAQAGQAIAQQKYLEDNSPDKLAAKQQQEYLAKAPEHFDSVNQLFQSNLGRVATQDELNHFGSLLASGTTDPYQLQQFLQQQPEYQTTQNQKMRTDLSGTMASNDKRQFSEQILPAIQQAYAKQGRSFDSSAFQAAATNAAQAQNTNRESFLNNLTASQYGGVQDRAYQDYANRVANQQALTNSGINAQYGGVQNTISRGNQISDFNMQQQAYNNYLSKYGKRNNGLGELLGTLGGAAIGGAYGGVQGARLGAGLGGTAGSYLGGGSY